jgi:hypothetical protein
VAVDAEAELGVVRSGDRVVDGVVSEDRKHRAELLLAGQRGILRQTRDNGRQHEVPAGIGVGLADPPRPADRRPLCRSIFHETLNPIAPGGGVQRSERHV